MSAITLSGDLIHYEVHGRGRPVILLHSWVGSWRYWVPTMQQLAVKYRVYVPDLLGFGDSAHNPNHYTIDHQVQVLVDFMEQMGFQKAGFVGHGLGALVTTAFARAYPDKAPRIMLVSAPLFDPGGLERRVPAARRPVEISQAMATNFEGTIMSSSVRAAMLELQRSRQGDETISSAAALAALDDSLSKAPKHNPFTERDGLLSLTPEAMLNRCFRRTDPIYEKLALDLPRTDMASIRTSVSDFDSGRFLDTIRLLPMPKIIVHGEDDPLLPVPTESVLNYLSVETEQIAPPVTIIAPDVRHFPMLEYERFSRLVNDFLEVPDLSTLEVKERWKRRTR
ncbi:MAG TPA: alpha/beta hydrolase [Aggregatilineales bacterium]|nr:alpha/beta hydrolase [Anaerolineae bacterium]HUN08498.1 alpha/beta hydrolase [Aggregatilineales bacterium]